MPNQGQISEQEILWRMHQRVNAAEKSRIDTQEQHSNVFHEHVSPAMRETGDDANDLRALHRQLEVVHVLHAAVGTVNPRNAGLINSAIQFAKKVMRRMLTWYTRPLHQFQAAVTIALQEQLHALETLNHQQRVRLDRQRTELEKSISSLASAQHCHVERLDTEIDKLRELRIQERLRQQEAKLRRLESAATYGPSGDARPIATPLPAAAGALDFDYFSFEERFRGDERQISNNQREYLQYFTGKENVIDLGCGRGEFLELLREHGVPAKGVEIGRDAVLICKEKGLVVSEGNLFDFLAAIPDKSSGGIFAAQVIEHLPVELQLRLIDLSFRKLQPGGHLVLETINPQCVFALVRNFFLDPSHVRPVHPEFLKFTLESKGFEDVTLKFSAPVPGKHLEARRVSQEPGQKEMEAAVLEMNDFLFGFQDYAAIGLKP